MKRSTHTCTLRQSDMEPEKEPFKEDSSLEMNLFAGSMFCLAATVFANHVLGFIPASLVLMKADSTGPGEASVEHQHRRPLPSGTDADLDVTILKYIEYGVCRECNMDLSKIILHVIPVDPQISC